MLATGLGDSRSKLDVGCRAPMEDGVRGWTCFPKTIKYKCFLAFDGRCSQNPMRNEKKDVAK